MGYLFGILPPPFLPFFYHFNNQIFPMENPVKNGLNLGIRNHSLSIDIMRSIGSGHDQIQ